MPCVLSSKDMIMYCSDQFSETTASQKGGNVVCVIFIVT